MGRLSNWLARNSVKVLSMTVGVRIPLYPQNNLKQIKAPSWSDIIKKNQSFKVLLSEYNISTQQREVEFPV